MLTWEAMASPGYDVRAASWNGASWSSVTALTDNSYNDYRSSVSCPSSSSCMAIWSKHPGSGDYEIAYFAWNGASWGSATIMNDNAFHDYDPDLSCPTTSFCMATWDGNNGGDNEIHYATWNGAAWSTDSALTDNGADDRYPFVSCPTTSFCMAAWMEGSSVKAASWNGAAWGTAATVGTGERPDVFCTTSSSCMVVYDGGSIKASTWDGSEWSSAGTLDTAGGNPAISCVG